ncbi:MAG: hypothetical protein ACNA74_04210 [Desulfurivibrio sp.]
MTTQERAKPGKDVRHDPVIAGILGRVPERVATTFSEEQLLCLKEAMGAHRGHRHPIDVRATVGLGRRRWYYVFLAGRDRVTSRRQEGRCSRLAVAVFWVFFLLLSLLLGLILLALLQWGLGVDLLAEGRLQLLSALDELPAWLATEANPITPDGGGL